ncbi:MAG: Crp/Fnr family transcriptional regulator [Thermodesulfobacteriota bacterium]
MRTGPESELAGVLAGLPLFAGLSREECQAVAAVARQESRPRGAAIFAEGDPGHGFYIVLEGRVKVFKLGADGKEQVLHLLGPGEPFGEVAVFAGRSFPAHAEALSRCRLLVIPRAAFRELLARQPSLALNLLASLSLRLRRFAQLIEDLSLKEVPGRLAAYLLMESDQNGGADVVRLEITKGLLASVLGTIPETLSRILARLSRSGLIAADGPLIRILDREGLAELAGGERRL